LTDPGAREREVTGLLNGWDWTGGGCLIGGYAVSAYARPRYSRDLDFVIPTHRESSLVGELVENGFVVRPHRPSGNDGGFKVATRLKRGNVTIDLLCGYVRDQSTKVVIPEAWISERHRDVRLLLITGSTDGLVKVCRPEALWVLKLIAGRDQDLGDLFALSTVTVDTDEIRRFLAKAMNEPLQMRLKDEARRLDSGKIYMDSLSARFLPTSPESARAVWKRFRERFDYIVS
jgi:hypothetical protein